MGAQKTGMRSIRWSASLALAAFVAFFATAAGAQAAKIDNPSPPNFRAEVTGGFLQFLGSTGTPLQLPLDFSTLDPPLPNPTLTGTVTVNGQRNGVINIPQAGISFPPIPVAVDDIALTVRLLPVADATGFIDPLSGRVDLNVPIRLKAEGSALGQSLGNNCFVGSAGNPINLGTTTHNGTFPSTSGGVYVADFVASDGFTGGWLAAEPYTDEAGTWVNAPKIVPGKPVGGASGKPLPSEIPFNELTDFISRAAGSWRGMNETLAAPAAAGCGTGLAAGIVNGQVNDLIGLPSQVGASTVSIDFKFNVFADRTGPNAIVQKATKSKFTAPGVSQSPWTSTQVPTAVSAQQVSIDASSSYFKAGANPTEVYAFDLGSGSFGPWTTNPVTTFTAPTLLEGASPVTLPIRVKVKDSDSDEDITTRKLRVVPATDIALTTSIASVAGSKFRAGSSAEIYFDVENRSANDASSQAIAFSATLPAGVSLTSLNSPGSWSCSSTASTISCSLPQAGLPAGQTDRFEVAVDVATDAVNPAVLQASALMAGDPASGNNSVSTPVDVVKTDLTVELTRDGALVANGWNPYAIDVSNVGDGFTVGPTTVEVSLPENFTYRSVGSGGSGWICVDSNATPTVVCSLAASIAGGASAPDLTVVARIDRSASAVEATVSAAVTTQGDVNAFSGANSDQVSGTIEILPDLAAEVSIAGDYKVGDPGVATILAVNEAVVPAAGPTTVSGTLPAGVTALSAAGNGWDCSATVAGESAYACVRAASLSGGESAPAITLNLGIAQAAYPSTSIAATVANETDGFAGNNSASATTRVRRLDLSIEKIAVRPFNVGIEGRYRLNVRNVGDATTVGSIVVTDQLPEGLELKSQSGGGWDCSASNAATDSVECVLGAVLEEGIQAAPIDIRVDVLDRAAELGLVENTGFVDTPRDERSNPADAAVTGNNSSTIQTTAVAVDLGIEATHPGSFLVGTEDVYSLTVTNVGAFGTDPGEAVTVTDQIPEGMIAQIDEIEVSRPGWTCIGDDGDVVCTLEAPGPLQSAMAANSTATIDIPVAVTDSAEPDSKNIAEVSTSRDSNAVLSPNNRAEDPTTVNRIDVELALEETIAPRAGGIGEVEVEVSNIGTASTAKPTVVQVSLAPDTSFRVSGSTLTGWLCSSPGVGTQITCSRTASIGSGADAPPLKLRTYVRPTALPTWTTTATAATLGEAPERTANNADSIDQVLEVVDLKITKSHNPANAKAGKRSGFQIVVENVGNSPSSGTIRVSDQINSAFATQNLTASGSGWTCLVSGRDISCTRIAPLGAGVTTPPVTVGFDIPAEAFGVRDSIAEVSHAGDPFPANNTDTDPITIVVSADVAVSVEQPELIRVGDIVPVTYQVTNVGADTTSGSPAITMAINLPDNLAPVSTSSVDGWACTPQEAVAPVNALFDCERSAELAAGETSFVTATVRVLPSEEPETLTLARATTAGDLNRANDVAIATSAMTGVDLSISASGEDAVMVAGVTENRLVSVQNIGTTTTTGPITVRVPLSPGVQWDDSVVAGTGWSCRLLSRSIVCDASGSVQADSSLPQLTLGLRASNSNAPGVDIEYQVETTGDENSANDLFERSEEVRFVPQTSITSAPQPSVTARSASIGFTSDEPNADFECKVDSGEFETCSSPLELSGLSLGSHSVLVRAVNEFGMTDESPAVANWTVIATTPTGPSRAVNLDLTGGSLSLASLGAVPLEPGLINLPGRVFTDNGALLIPQETVNFDTVVQTIPDVLGPGTVVSVEISISATGDGLGTLPAGGGPASLTLPVRADVQAKLGSLSLIPAGTECALNPVTFDLSGSYDQAAGEVSLSSSSVAFPKITGCATFKETIDGLLELPRSDISIAMDFGIEEIPDATPARLSSPKIQAPRSLKAGKSLTLRSQIKNTGQTAASNTKVCLKSATAVVKGAARRCQTVSIPAGATRIVAFTVATKSGARGERARFEVSAEYTSAGRKITNRVGHVTLMK